MGPRTLRTGRLGTPGRTQTPEMAPVGGKFPFKTISNSIDNLNNLSNNLNNKNLLNNLNNLSNNNLINNKNK